jgi:hypothetical protein
MNQYRFLFILQTINFCQNIGIVSRDPFPSLYNKIKTDPRFSKPNIAVQYDTRDRGDLSDLVLGDFPFP